MKNNQADTYQTAMRPAYSLVEVVLIVALISVSFVAIMNLVQKTLQVEHLAKNDFIARGLAEECLELAEEKRNYNEINQTGDFDNGISTGEYAIDHTGTPVTLAGATLGAAGSRLLLDTTGGDYYQHQSGDNTDFYRTVTFTHNAGTPESLDVKCTVQFGNRGDTRSVTLHSKLYDL